MFERPEELLRKIHLEENSLLELKTVRFKGNQVSNPNHDDLADELAAFANSRGGVLVLGVDDKTRDVIGISIDNLDTVGRSRSRIMTPSGAGSKKLGKNATTPPSSPQHVRFPRPFPGRLQTPHMI